MSKNKKLYRKDLVLCLVGFSFNHTHMVLFINSILILKNMYLMKRGKVNHMV